MKESLHFLTMLRERSINRDWVNLAVENPDYTENRDDGTKHFIKVIPENDGRFLRVIVNIKDVPNKFVTAFFDRRLKRKHESRNR